MVGLADVDVSFGPVRALDGASLRVQRGEFVALLGPSGCGKTTALRVLAGFERPDRGRVELDGRTVAGDGAWVAPERRAVGMVFQDFALFPHLDVAGNVGFGLPRRGRERRVAEVLDLVGLGGAGHRRVGELSGGQQQRVALARALAPSPSVVLLDEPWSAIDPLLRSDVRTELARILRAADVTVVLVTHDREEAFTLADRIAIMREGRILQTGVPEELYHHPADRWVAEFVGGANVLDADAARGLLAGPVDDDAHVLVRPELLALVPDEARGGGEVVERVFLGHDVLYHVRLPDGTIVCSQRPSNEVVPLGARVRVVVQQGPQAVFGA